MKKRTLILALVSSFGVLSAQAQDLCTGVPECVMDLREAIDSFSDGLQAFIGHAAAEAAKRMDEAHDAAIDATGLGLYYGAYRSPLDSWSEIEAHDCTTYLVTVLKAAFDAADLGDEIRDLISDAAANGGGALKGIDLMQLMQERFAWDGAYWNPDVAHPSDADDEHPYSAYLASKGSYYGIDVDPEHAVLNYRPSWNSDTEQDTTGIEALEQLPFAILAARGGKHMAVLVNGQVYEVHWLASASSRDVITSTPLSEFDWLSGAIVYPSGTWPSADELAAAQEAEASEEITADDANTADPDDGTSLDPELDSEADGETAP